MKKLNTQIEKLRNEIKNEKNVYPNYKYLDLQKLIDKRDKLFHSLGY